MKKITALLVSLIMSCAVMAGCSDSSSSSSSKADSTSRQKQAQPLTSQLLQKQAQPQISRILSQRSIQKRFRARALLST